MRWIAHRINVCRIQFLIPVIIVSMHTLIIIVSMFILSRVSIIIRMIRMRIPMRMVILIRMIILIVVRIRIIMIRMSSLITLTIYTSGVAVTLFCYGLGVSEEASVAQSGATPVPRRHNPPGMALGPRGRVSMGRGLGGDAETDGGVAGGWWTM